jgi:rubrerythrin
MKKLLGLLIGAMLLMAVHSAWADDSVGSASAVSTPAVSAAQMIKHKVKKNKKKMAAATTAAVAKTYVCPMDGYTSNQPGPCPKCGMTLVEKK